MIVLPLLLCMLLVVTSQLIHRHSLPRQFGEFITVLPNKIGSLTYIPSLTFFLTYRITYSILTF